MGKAPTVYDVAAAAGVSIATVSFAFRQPEKIRPATAEAVYAAARALGYVPSASARGLAAGRTGVIGLISWDIYATSPARVDPFGNEDLRHFPRYVDEVQRGIEIATWRNGYSLLVGGGNHRNSESTIIDIAGRSDALVVFPNTTTAETIVPIAERIPVVIVSEFAGTEKLNRVTIENEDGIAQLTRHLVREHGVRRPQFVGGVGSMEFRARWEAFRDTLLAEGITPPSEPVTAEGGAVAAVLALLERVVETELPDALVCRTDADALDVIDALRTRGLAVPGRIIVTGFDGIAAGLVSTPRLTTVRQPMQALGEAAVDLLIAQLTTPSAPLTRTLPTRLAARESCGCTPA
ncbi:LacI family DNA-binding transcriptional regulator [Mycetocola saprophilus]|uniref:LacI family DNA-binding transcriptional regulator n=1 Tax=Mycetocola saprophilus TaxID=76636 RepID=UPI0004C297B5|nr:LacI family DNA-binding transcriptional regulator [Mycetocola saprophilus]